MKSPSAFLLLLLLTTWPALASAPVTLTPGPETRWEPVRDDSVTTVSAGETIAWGAEGKTLPAIKLDCSLDRGTERVEAFRIPLPQPVEIMDGMDVCFSAVLSLTSSAPSGALLAAGPVVSYGTEEKPGRRAFAAGVAFVTPEGAAEGSPLAVITRDGKATPVPAGENTQEPLVLDPPAPFQILIRLAGFKTKGYAMPEMAVAVRRSDSDPVRWTVVKPGGNMNEIRSISAIELQIRAPSGAYMEMRNATGLVGAIKLGFDESDVK